MKKIFTLIAVLSTAFAAQAKDYTSTMSIALNGGEPAGQEATVSATRSENGDNIFYDIVLKQFSFMGQLIGDVTIEGVGADDSEGMGGYSFFHATTKEAQITNGGNLATILGGKVTVTIHEGSCVNEDNMYLELAIPVKIMASTINVDAIFGTDPGFPVYYTDKMAVTMMGNAFPEQEATIMTAKQSNGKYTLALKNFELAALGGIGTIEMTDVDAVKNGDVITLSTNQEVTIQPGDDPDKKWTMAGYTVPVEMKAEIENGKMYAEINIPLNATVTVNVVFGSKTDTGITTVTTAGKETIYGINGHKLSNTQKGLNIIRKADGTTVKVLKK